MSQLKKRFELKLTEISIKIEEGKIYVHDKIDVTLH